LNPVRPIYPYLPKVQFNVILTPTSRSSHWSLAFGQSVWNRILKICKREMTVLNVHIKLVTWYSDKYIQIWIGSVLDCVPHSSLGF
jgi:hypothetical protein